MSDEARKVKNNLWLSVSKVSKAGPAQKAGSAWIRCERVIANNALKVSVAKCAALRVAYDGSGRLGVSGRRINSCTGHRHC